MLGHVVCEERAMLDFSAAPSFQLRQYTHMGLGKRRITKSSIRVKSQHHPRKHFFPSFHTKNRYFMACFKAAGRKPEELLRTILEQNFANAFFFFFVLDKN